MRVLWTMGVLGLMVGCREKDANTDTSGETETGGETGAVDADADGFAVGEDCNDSDATVNPDARETCDGIDNDCDGLFDDEDNDVFGTDFWYIDVDGDGYGSDDYVLESCEQPDGYVDNDNDCDDSDASSQPGADEVCDGTDNDCDGTIDGADATDALTWYIDEDGDGYGTSGSLETACDPPAGYALHDGDCDDADPAYHPGASETDCADANDYNCDGSVGFADADADGFAACEDCDDSDANANDDASEVCDGVDNDCDGDIDSEDGSVTGTTTFYGDADGDGYGGLQFQTDACEAPAGFVTSADDCDDLDPTSHPGASEVCDEADNDCDTDIDEGVALTWFADADGDGYGDSGSTAEACTQPPGYSTNGNDCDDGAPATNPSAYEVCDSADNDCDGSVDEDAINAATWYVDTDGDGYGTLVATTSACEVPTGYAGNATDCDDAASGVNPGAAEVCDSVDNNCDGSTDEGVTTVYYADTDSDGYGDAASSTEACSLPASGYVTDATDCDDALTATNPGATETCNTVDDDCDGTVDEDDASDASTWYEDVDSDTYGNLSSSTVSCTQPGGYVADATDCDDTLTATNPGATETCNTVDDDCDGTVDEDDASDASTWYEDGDTDTYGNPSNSSVSCTQPGGYVADATDCDDTDALYSPGATEACDDPDYNCDGVTLLPCPYAIATITENQGVQLTDYAVRVDISAHSSALSGGFSIADPNENFVDYCFEVQSGNQEGECTSSYTDIIWVKLPSLLASGTVDLSIHPGLDLSSYPGSSEAGTGLDVFEVYEDFQDTTQASGISGWDYNDFSSGYIAMAGNDTYYVGLNGTGLTSSVHKKIDYYQGTWSAESDLTFRLDGTDYGGDIDVYSCPGRPSGARSWTIIKTNELSYQICGSSGAQPGPFSPSVGSSFVYEHRSNDTDGSGMTLNWISMRPYVDNEPSSVVNLYQ